ncbi:MAG: iron-sulfur cluster assembly protein [Chloroflexi bacterium]|nr:iron-sulfur cluster assembly protein [Chloroflexota bacterium]
MAEATEATALTKEAVMEALRDVYDPEIPVNVVDLGLIYGCEVKDGTVNVQMTLTFAGCGMGPYIAQQAEWRIAEMDEVEDVHVEMVYEPAWSPDLITPEGKAQLGLD